MRENNDKTRQKDIPEKPIDTHGPKPTNPGYDENVKRDDKRHPHQGNPPPGK